MLTAASEQLSQGPDQLIENGTQKLKEMGSEYVDGLKEDLKAEAEKKIKEEAKNRGKKLLGKIGGKFGSFKKAIGGKNQNLSKINVEGVGD